MKNLTASLLACLFVAGPLDIFAEDRPTVPVVQLDRVTLTRAVAAELDRARVKPATRPAPPFRLQQNPQKAGWIRRHPILFGTLAGFGTGFVIGCLPHEDNALYLFPGCYNGLYVGGIGAGIGAAVGAIVRRS
jgi:hypothetical protein